MIKDWNIKIDGRDLNEAEIIDALLESRGITECDKFLEPTVSNMIPFDKMYGLEEGYQIIVNTINNGGKFVIHFDVDTDGTTSGAIMTRYLLNYTDQITTVINSGKDHGIEEFDLELLDDNTTLIVVDSLNNADTYRRILSTGAQLIVLDHHKIEQELIDANLPFCLISSANNYPNPALSGAGVVFKFCQYIDSETWNNYADEFWDLAAVGLIADMSDVSEKSPENRYICHMGFTNLKNTAIAKINGAYKFDSKSISFGIAPLVNAANRMNENNKAKQLFLSDDTREVNALIRDLKKCKEKQNDIINEYLEDLIAQGEQQSNQKCMYFFMDGDREVAGLVGNKLLERYQRPLFVLTKMNDTTYGGSMRAMGLEDFAQIVNDIGIGQCLGHELAAGVFIPIDRLEDFKNTTEEALKDVEFKQTIDVDIQLDPEQITDMLIRKVKEINRISGAGFPSITVMIGEVSDFTIGNMSNGKHLKITTPDVTFIKWNFSGWDELWDLEDKEFYGVGQLDSGYFGRQYYKQLILNDFKFEDMW